MRVVFTMQMLCKASSAVGDLRCPVCQQDFVVYWTRERAHRRKEALQGMQESLQQQHGANLTAQAHPAVLHLADQGVPGLQGAPAGMPITALHGVYS